jgi:DNA-binding transcriptional ArsR family regulator
MAQRDPFDALGDPNRRAIVEVLRAGDRSVGELTEALGNRITRPAVSGTCACSRRPAW